MNPPHCKLNQIFRIFEKCSQIFTFFAFGVPFFETAPLFACLAELQYQPRERDVYCIEQHVLLPLKSYNGEVMNPSAILSCVQTQPSLSAPRSSPNQTIFSFTLFPISFALNFFALYDDYGPFSLTLIPIY